jgi:hypothetical protein
MRRLLLTALALAVSACGASERRNMSPLEAQVAAGTVANTAGAEAPSLHRVLFIGDEVLETAGIETPYCLIVSEARLASRLACESIYGRGATMAGYARDLSNPRTDVGTRIGVAAASDSRWDVVVLQERLALSALDASGADASRQAMVELATAAARHGARVLVVEPWVYWADLGLPDGPAAYAERVRAASAWADAVVAQLRAADLNAEVAPLAIAAQNVLVAGMGEGKDPFSPPSVFSRLSNADGTPTVLGAYLLAQVVANKVFAGRSAALDWVDDRVPLADGSVALQAARTASTARRP